jgi:hypothetical protein
MTLPYANVVDDEDLLRRAFAAYFRSGGPQAAIPSNNSEVRIHEGKLYVVLRNTNGTLAVYRVRNDGVLKGLRRWPHDLDEY